MVDAIEPNDDMVTVSKETVTDSRGSMVIRQGYTPPLDGSDDDLREYDMFVARRVAELLAKFYFGYSWHVGADSRQGVIYFAIPDLMGPTLKYVIRLAQFSDLTPSLIRDKAGELLERMRLPRGPMDTAKFIDALASRHLFHFDDIGGKRRRG